MYNPLYFRLKQIIITAKFYEDLYFSTEASYIRLQAEHLLEKEFKTWLN